MSEYMIRPCGISWAYCDGDCADCPLMGMTCSDRTDEPREGSPLNEFRERLKKLREKEGTQPCVLAELCGISKNSILRYERDGVIPEIVSVVKIADHFNVSVDYLLGRTDDPNAM